MSVTKSLTECVQSVFDWHHITLSLAVMYQCGWSKFIIIIIKTCNPEQSWTQIQTFIEPE